MSKAGEIAVGIIVELFFAALALGLLYRLWARFFSVPQKRIVAAFQRGVVLRGGQVEKVLEPGSYWITPKRTLILCDMRAIPFQVPAQELVTADTMGVRIGIGGEYRVADAVRFVMESSNSFGAFSLEVRQALHSSVRELTGEGVAHEQTLLLARIKELIVPRAAQLGIEVIQLQLLEVIPVGWLRNVR